MSSVESNTLTFVVTIWIDSDDISEPISETSWRGEIRNVLQNESKRVAFTSLADIEAHIKPYLEARGVQFGPLYCSGRSCTDSQPSLNKLNAGMAWRQ